MDKEDLLNGYFENSLGEEELMDFNELLKSDPEFLKEFNFRKDLKKAIKQNERKELKEKLIRHESQKRTFPFNWRYAAAAVLVLGFGTYFLVNDFQNTEDLYSAYYETYPNTVSPIVRADPAEDSLETKAFQAYENKNIDEAIDLFSNIYELNQSEYAVFYQAMSILESGKNTEEAIRILQNTEWSQQYEDKSLWYLALAHLKLEDVSQAKETLEKLSRESNYRKDEVKQLLGKL